MLGRQHLGIWQLLIGRHTLLGRDGTRERLGGVGAISLNEKNFAAPQTLWPPSSTRHRRGQFLRRRSEILERLQLAPYVCGAAKFELCKRVTWPASP